MNVVLNGWKVSLSTSDHGRMIKKQKENLGISWREAEVEEYIVRTSQLNIGREGMKKHLARHFEGGSGICSGKKKLRVLKCHHRS